VPDHILTEGLDRLLEEDSTDVLITEFDFGAGGSARTWYLNNPIQSPSNAGLLTPTQPAASTSTTGWTVGLTVAARYSRMTYNAEVPADNFTITVQPSGQPVSAAEDCWRISAVTSGHISAGTWTSSVSVIAVTSGGDQDGRARFMLWKSVDTTGKTFVGGPFLGTTVTNLATTVAQSSATSFSMPGVELDGEYLYLQVAWETTGAGGAADRDVLVRFGNISSQDGSGLITSGFSAMLLGGAAASGAGYYFRRRALDAMTNVDELC